MISALSQVLGNYFFKSFASIKLIEQIIIGLFYVRDVNLTQLALVIEGNGNDHSHYRKLQRFFSGFNFCYTALAKLLVALARIESEKWLLALDRTNWKFGKLDINILVLSICHNGIAIPIMWDMLAKTGASNSDERQKLINRFLQSFGVEKISALLGDREFIGDMWLKFLADHKVPFYIRIKENLTIGRSEDELVSANHLVKKLKNNEYKVLNGKRHLGKNYKGPKVSVAALRNDEGVLVIIATNDNPHIALSIYKKRWEIETLFGCLKTRGFNFENTHMIDLDRISKLLGLLAIAFTFAYVVGM
ncbi:IS4 family transposase [Candidatus Tisiphia endosymbiont of Temnostethus pusillus]|uniref:IS4 family transposase n=1 Tax=Candidatus Tisiphia endosymbiont of Temnostethus pusillus TaxID=3139335 RepID=UPI0035C92D76